MKKTVLNYTILIEKELQDDKKILYVAYSPTLGISDFGKSTDEASFNIEKAIEIYIKSLQELGEPISKPDSEEYFVTSAKITFDTPIGNFIFD